MKKSSQNYTHVLNYLSTRKRLKCQESKYKKYLIYSEDLRCVFLLLTVRGLHNNPPIVVPLSQCHVKLELYPCQESKYK
jgi:hypothetical protein